MLERAKKLADEVARFEASEFMPVKEVCDILMDKDLEVNTQALRYIFRELQIPAGYFKGAPENHQKEILNNARGVHPEFSPLVLMGDKGIDYAGPETELSFVEVLDQFSGLMESTPWVSGSLSSGRVRILHPTGAIKVKDDDYLVGVDITLSPFFVHGVRFFPLIFQVVCTNGIIDIKSQADAMRLEAEAVNKTTIEYGLAAALGVSREQAGRYWDQLETMEKKEPEGDESIIYKLGARGFPKGFRDKAVSNFLRVIEGRTDKTELPEELNSHRDELSVLTYTARDFNSCTRQKIEGRIYQEFMEAV